ncbi:G-patch domain-containing protein [Blastomyces dermatitidis ER-3]|uniref:G-patch domain-containing protein n=1 Tax=Ajellomyces dermatitidis (strain ER-3 / ATCC MYA-2586) TaxID=559297 RepID=A0ABP2EPN4_AJEDR|nr:G-patch domain-containing protein [Blastomyces dermatitidis ER-3]EEQ85153.2 G-patch domain-containing protein [Blastomyces dermatitidis ER-3]
MTITTSMSAKRSRATFEDEHLHAPYAIYGTPLPPLDPEVRDDGSYVPVWKQEVRDERGRKRLHGAFTGGFSAGYFNTVGSKEGWTPSTFVSSRRNRAKDDKQPTHQQRPEDFMDEEDLREAEEARKLQTAGEYAGFGSTASDATRLGGLMDIFKITGDTIGVKLLKRMGWKEGQGIGPKVRRKADLGDGADAEGKVHLFAPTNPPMISFVKKNDHKGLGFEGEARLDATVRLDTGAKPRALAQAEDSDQFGGPKPPTNGNDSRKQKPSRRGGFGVGVLNDTGSDDEDPYEMGPQISYNRFIDHDKKAKKTSSNSSAVTKPSIGLSNPLLGTKPVFISKKKVAAEKTKAGFRKCHDGRLPLDGFLHGVEIAGLTISTQEKKYAAPEIPKDWKSAKGPSRTGPIQNYMSSAEAAKASSLDPTSRAALLGEAQLPGKSVFDYMTPAGRDKIVKATGRTDLPPALGEKGPEGFLTTEAQKQQDLWNLVPKLDKDVAVQALNRGISGWMPYAEDEAKRSRYRSFLEVRAGLRDKLPDRAPGATTDDWLTELQEFARAAQVFRPVSGLMASRFTSSSDSSSISQQQQQSQQSQQSHSTPAGAVNAQHEPLIRRPDPKPQDPAEAAAEIGMYGPLTRSSIPFSPSRLLCKRFNVRPPSSIAVDAGDMPGGPGRTPTMPSGSKLDILSKEAVNRILMGAGAVVATAGACASAGWAEGEQQQEQQGQDQRPLERKEIVVDPGRNEALEAERPGDAVFKAIFGSDDEGDGDGDEDMD